MLPLQELCANPASAGGSHISVDDDYRPPAGALYSAGSAASTCVPPDSVSLRSFRWHSLVQFHSIKWVSADVVSVALCPGTARAGSGGPFTVPAPDTLHQERVVRHPVRGGEKLRSSPKKFLGRPRLPEEECSKTASVPEPARDALAVQLVRRMEDASEEIHLERGDALHAGWSLSFLRLGTGERLIESLSD